MPAIATFHDLKDASIFITGGGSGIGAALTEGFLEQGAKVAFVGRGDYSEFARQMEQKFGQKPLFIRCDITDTQTLQSAIDQASSAHGPISVLINNAADDTRFDALSITPDEWDQQLAVNLKAYFFACQKVAPAMRDNGGGSIVNFSSITYMFGASGMAPYVTANAGIMGMTRSLAREWGPHRIRVNAIAPGWVMTDKQLTKWATKESLTEHRARQCLPDMIQPKEMVGTALFLASGLSKMLTSQVIPVDAGMVMAG